MAYNPDDVHPTLAPLTNSEVLRAEVVDNQGTHYGDPGSTKAVMAKLNTKSADPTICRTPQNSSARTISGDDLLEAMLASSAEYKTQIVDGWMGGAADPDPDVDTARSAMRTQFINQLLLKEEVPTRFQNELIGAQGAFNQADAPTIRGAMIAEATGPMSMAEILFGDDTQLTKRDYTSALGAPDPLVLMDAAEQAAYVSEYMAHYNQTYAESTPAQRQKMNTPAEEEVRITEVATTTPAPGQTNTWS